MTTDTEALRAQLPGANSRARVANIRFSLVELNIDA